MTSVTTTVRGLTLATLALGALMTQTAQAHTTIQVQANEATTTYNNVVIGHGCTVNGTALPVIAQSVLFPTVNPVVTVSGAGASTATENPLSIATFANIAQLIQSRDVFTRQVEKKNAAGQVIGFESTEGSLLPELHGLVPFRTAGVSFKANSCAKQLQVKVAIADICTRNVAFNLWIPQATAKYNSPTIDGIGSPATLTFNRDLTKNPLPAGCGEGYTITVSPSAEDVDANLQIPGYLP
jgi:hypothetical protein